MAQPEPPREYVEPRERLAAQDWAGVAKTGLSGMAPADKGWVLAVAVMFLGMMVVNYFTSTRQANLTMEYLGNSHELKSIIEDNRAQELRRCQESVRELTQVVARESERLGRRIERTAVEDGE